MKAAKVTVYALTIHCSAALAPPKERSMLSRAVLTIVTSSCTTP
jgi:hypothetical protein